MNPTNDADGGDLHDPSVEKVTTHASALVIMAAASVPEGSGSWFGEANHEHAHVPWLVDLDNACTAALALVEILFLVDFGDDIRCKRRADSMLFLFLSCRRKQFL